MTDQTCADRVGKDLFFVGIGSAVHFDGCSEKHLAVYSFASCDRRVGGLLMTAPWIRTGEDRGRRAVIVKPTPNGSAVGVIVGKDVVDALLAERIFAEGRRVFDARRNVHMIEYLISGGDPARVIELDVERITAGRVHP